MCDRIEIEKVKSDLEDVTGELYPRTDYIEVKDTDGNVVERIEANFNGPGVPEINHVGYVPKSDLEELVERWRDKARTFSPERNKALKQCANDLSEVIEE